LYVGRVLVWLGNKDLKKGEPVTVSLAPEFISPDFSVLVGKIFAQSQDLDLQPTKCRVTLTFTPSFDLEFKLDNPKSSELKDLPTEVDVLVIGGGYTGVQTAAHLLEQGVNVVLLEAHEILGGRNKPGTLKTTKGDVVYDFGSEYSKI
jgi:hypothetical protein